VALSERAFHQIAVCTAFDGEGRKHRNFAKGSSPNPLQPIASTDSPIIINRTNRFEEWQTLANPLGTGDLVEHPSCQWTTYLATHNNPPSPPK